MLKKRVQAAHNTARSVLAHRSINAVLVLLLCLSSSLVLTSPALAARASTLTPRIPLTGYCPNPQSNHCYAMRVWYGHTGGAHTLINPYGALSCFGCASTGFIDDEMWFQDSTSSQCTHTPLGVCWVEAGVSTYQANSTYNCFPGIDSTCLFWADNRPNGGGYTEHPLFRFGPDGVDLTPYLIYIWISNNNGYSSSGSTWAVNIDVYKNGSLVYSTNNVESRNNQMNVDTIYIGSELADPNGAAGPIYLQDNQWLSGSGGWIYQTTQGTDHIEHPINVPATGAPPTGFWATTPCSCNGNTGGSFETYD